MTGGDDVSPQWRAWRAQIDLDEYERRFQHEQAHGEADLIELLARQVVPLGNVLDAGCGTGRVAIELHRRGVPVVGVDLDDDMLALARAKAPDVAWVHADLATMRLGLTFDVVAMAGNVMVFCRDTDRGAVVQSCAAHLRPDGLLVAGFGGTAAPDMAGQDVAGLDVAGYDALCAECGLTLVERWSSWDRAPFAGGNYAVSVHRRSS